jgi:hypothetical protein
MHEGILATAHEHRWLLAGPLRAPFVILVASCEAVTGLSVASGQDFWRLACPMAVSYKPPVAAPSDAGAMRHITESQMDAAERFVWLSGRVLDRHLFAHHFRAGDPDRVVEALRPYRNPDGGFGNGLEPDLRGPTSQPQPLEVALRILDEVDRFSDPLVGAACDWLAGASRPGGGVPFVLPTVRSDPRAPWWETPDDPPGALNPTAALAGLLHRHGVEHPWLREATAFCWRGIEAMTATNVYEVRAVLLFLDNVPDRGRAEAAFERVRQVLAAGDLVVLDPEAAPDGELHRPLELAPGPGSMGRRLFADDVIERNLDALAAGQREDGGWTVDFPSWTPATGLEWRAWATVGALAVLRAYGR